jgi:hypothetical protein
MDWITAILKILRVPCIGQSTRHSSIHPTFAIAFFFFLAFGSIPFLSNPPFKPFAPVHFQAPTQPLQYSVHSLPLPALTRSSVFRLRQSSVNFLGAFLIRARTQFPDVAALVLYGGK